MHDLVIGLVWQIIVLNMQMTMLLKHQASFSGTALLNERKHKQLGLVSSRCQGNPVGLRFPPKSYPDFRGFACWRLELITAYRKHTPR